MNKKEILKMAFVILLAVVIALVCLSVCRAETDVRGRVGYIFGSDKAEAIAPPGYNKAIHYMMDVFGDSAHATTETFSPSKEVKVSDATLNWNPVYALEVTTNGPWANLIPNLYAVAGVQYESGGGEFTTSQTIVGTVTYRTKDYHEAWVEPHPGQGWHDPWVEHHPGVGWHHEWWEFHAGVGWHPPYWAHGHWHLGYWDVPPYWEYHAEYWDTPPWDETHAGYWDTPPWDENHPGYWDDWKDKWTHTSSEELVGYADYNFFIVSIPVGLEYKKDMGNGYKLVAGVEWLPGYYNIESTIYPRSFVPFTCTGKVYTDPGFSSDVDGWLLERGRAYVGVQYEYKRFFINMGGSYTGGKEIESEIIRIPTSYWSVEGMIGIRF
jgi:hypothetical protein